MNRYKLEFNERMTADQIKSLVDRRTAENTNLNNLESYYLGKNPGISGRSKPSGYEGPWNQIPVPKARSLVNVVTGFMFKPGLIRYELSDAGEAESAEYMNQILSIFQENEESEINSQLGKDQALFGCGYELHYVTETPDKPLFARVDPREIVLVYTLDLRPKLAAAIRFYSQGEDTKIHVLYPDVEAQFTLTKDGMVSNGETPHPFKSVPVAVFENNAELTSDIEPVKQLLDAFDLMLSTSMDEEQKFADAYLLLRGGLRMDKEDVKQLGSARVLEAIGEGQGAEFLTKPSDRTSRAELLEIIKKEINGSTFIPDLTDPGALSNRSGEAMAYLFALFELLAGVKQSYFDKGINQRIRLITQALSVAKENLIGDPTKINHVWSRNLPKNLVQISQLVSTLSGLVSRETLLAQVPFVEDPAKEIERLKGEQDLTLTPAGDAFSG